MSGKVRFQVGGEDDEEGPILCCFTGGNPPILSEKEEDSVTFRMYAHKDRNSGGRKGHQRILHGETDIMSYTAKNFGMSNPLTPRYAVGLVKEQEDSYSVSLLPVKQVIFQLNQTMKGEEGESEEEEEEEKLLAGEYLMKRKLLVEAFGSRKRQRMIRSQIANAIQIDGDVSSQHALTHALTNSTATEEVIEEKVESVLEFLPPHNATTTEPGKIYEMRVLFDAELIRALEVKDMAKSHQSTSQQAAFVKYALPRVPKNDKKKQKNVCRALLYLDYLLAFNKLDRNNKSKGLQHLGLIPDIIKAQLLGDFTVNLPKGGKIAEVHTSALNQKLLCWISVLALLGSSGAVDGEGLKILAADLKITVQKLLVYFKQVGCPSASKSKCVLTAPLKQPELRLPKQKNT